MADYSIELAEEICSKLATSTSGIAKLISENKHWPHKQTIFEWRIKHKEFGEMYDTAKRNQIEALIDEIIEISDDIENDKIMNDKGHLVQNTEYIARSRLRVDTRKWLAAKLAPKIYGEKTESKVEHVVTHEDWTKLLK